MGSHSPGGEGGKETVPSEARVLEQRKLVYRKVSKLYITHIHIYPFFFRFFPHLDCYRVLSRVSCPIH